MADSIGNDTEPSKVQAGDLWLRNGMALWIVLAVAVTVKTLVQGDHHSVYNVFAVASQNWWAERSLYDLYEGVGIYLYSPTFAVAFTPFAMLPSRLGNILWNLPCVFLLLWSLRILVRNVLPGEWTPWRKGLFLGLAALISIPMVWTAQSNTLLIALICFSATAIVRERWWTASCLLAVPVFIKLWPMAVVLLLMVCWPRKLSWRFPVPMAVLAAVPFLTRPFHIVLQQYHNWYVCLTRLQQGRFPGYRDAWTIWEELCPPPDRQIYMLMQLVAAALVLIWCLWQRRRTRSTGYLLTLILSMWVCWQLLLGPGTEQLTYGIMAPFMAWAVAATFGRKQQGNALAAAACAIVILFGLGDIEKEVLSFLPFARAILPIGVVLFAVWLVWHGLELIPSGGTDINSRLKETGRDGPRTGRSDSHRF